MRHRLSYFQIGLRLQHWTSGLFLYLNFPVRIFHLDPLYYTEYRSILSTLLYTLYSTSVHITSLSRDPHPSSHLKEKEKIFFFLKKNLNGLGGVW